MVRALKKIEIFRSDTSWVCENCNLYSSIRREHFLSLEVALLFHHLKRVVWLHWCYSISNCSVYVLGPQLFHHQWHYCFNFEFLICFPTAWLNHLIATATDFGRVLSHISNGFPMVAVVDDAICDLYCIFFVHFIHSLRFCNSFIHFL